MNHRDFEEMMAAGRPESKLKGRPDDPLLSVTYAQQDEWNTMWPQRLLFVPEMRSYERKHGNRYGATSEPRYNILSYTWGRWQDATGQSQGLRIEGIEWETPRIQPQIFTTESFRDILVKVSTDVDWIWVDVACIDQGDTNVQVRDEEVGRQAGIFARANQAFVWLHQSPTQKLQQFSDELFGLSHRCGGDQAYVQRTEVGDMNARYGVSYDTGKFPSCVIDPLWLEGVSRSLEMLEDGPWFSSLWTLQESHLRPDAAILSREGEQLSREGYYEVGLVSFLTAWGDIELALRRTLKIMGPSGDEHSDFRAAAGNILRRMDTLGFGAYDNPVILYSAAGYRETQRDDDRIYGIMQVFGLKLGKSVSPGMAFTLAELETQFAAAMNMRSPLWAQLYVHTIEQPPGRRWCISQSSRIPECLVMDFVVARSQCNISVDSHGHPSFTGLSCSFLDLKGACDSTRTGPFIRTAWQTETVSGALPVEAILLDECGEVLRRIPKELHRLDDEQDDRHKDLGDVLLENYGDELRAFYCGTLQTEPDEGSDLSGVEDEAVNREEDPFASVAILALRVFRSGNTFWQRIGICVWTSLPHLHASSIQWATTTAVLD